MRFSLQPFRGCRPHACALTLLGISAPCLTAATPAGGSGPPPVDLGDGAPAGGATAADGKFPQAGEPPAVSEILPPVKNPPPGAVPPPPVPASQNVTANLINRLVQRGVLTKQDASELMQLAEADAAAARTQQEAANEYAELVGGGRDEEVRVPYIPEVVRTQMRDEIKAELMAQAQRDGWSGRDSVPAWVKRMNVFGDIRVRGEGDFFPGGGGNGAFPNFNAINTGAPFDTSGTVFSPQLNTDEDRYRPRIRARAGAEIMVGDGFTAGLRVATGESSTPVSPNQSMGLANQGQGGNFSKYALWLDRAFIRREATFAGGEGKLTANFGRFDNPFFGTDVTWNNDLGFDGAAVQATWKATDRLTPFFNGGAFPVFNTDLNFASNRPDKFKSTDKWLLGAQAGLEWKIKDDLTAKVAAAYYFFDGVQGKRSNPYTPLNPTDAGNTDDTRPSFAQKGNTYFPLRDIVPTAANGFGTQYQYQYYGLASQFHEAVLTGRVDYDGFDPFRLSVVGEYVNNLGFDRSQVASMAVNNFGSGGTYQGGNKAAGLTVTIGKPALEHPGDWLAFIGYRYIESDSVIDGLTDSDFGLGGTNLKGFTIGGQMAINPSTQWGIRWMSADEVSGPAFRSDVLMIDMQTKF